MNIGSIYNTGGGVPTQVFTKAGSSAGTESPVATYNGAFAGISFLGQPFSFYLGLIAILFLLKWFGELPQSPINPAHLHIGIYNVMGVGVTSLFFLVTLKLLMSKYPIMGLSQVANYV